MQLTVSDDEGATNSTTVDLVVEAGETETPATGVTDTPTPAGPGPGPTDSGGDSSLLSPSALVVYLLGGLLVYALVKW